MSAMHHSRQQTRWVFRGIVLLMVASMLLAPIGAAASPSQSGVSWDYKLLGKLNSSTDPATELTIVMTGSGSFDLRGNIDGGGGYTILNGEGAVLGDGTWAAKTFTNFTPVGPGRSPGEGGRLELEAWFSGVGKVVLYGLQPVVIQCSMWGDRVGPPGYPWPPDFVEVGPYTTHRTGAVMFNLNQ